MRDRTRSRKYLQQVAACPLITNLPSMLSNFAKSFEQISIDNFQQVTLIAVLNLTKQLVLAGIESMDNFVQLTLGLLDGFLSAIQNCLVTAIGVPILDSFYQNVICPSGKEEPLTCLHLVSLLVAVPFTISYKLGNNNVPPFTSVTAAATVSPVGAYLKTSFAAITGIFDMLIINNAIAKRLAENPPGTGTNWFNLFGGVFFPTLKFVINMPGPATNPNITADMIFWNWAHWSMSGGYLFTNIAYYFYTGCQSLARVNNIATASLCGFGIAGMFHSFLLTTHICSGIIMAAKKIQLRIKANLPTDNQICGALSDLLPHIEGASNGLFIFVEPGAAEALEVILPIIYACGAVGNLSSCIFPLVSYYKGFIY